MPQQQDFMSWLQQQIGLKAPPQIGPRIPLPKRDPNAPLSMVDKIGDFTMGMLGVDDPLADDASVYTGAGSLTSLLGPAAIGLGMRALRRAPSAIKTGASMLPNFRATVLNPPQREVLATRPVLDLNNTIDTAKLGDVHVPQFGEQRYLPLPGGRDPMMHRARFVDVKPLKGDEIYESMAPSVTEIEYTRRRGPRYHGDNHRAPLVERGWFPGLSPSHALTDVSTRADVLDARALRAQSPSGILDFPLPAGSGETYPSVVRGDGFTVYHASPYKFDKFDMGKIGTGEGATWGSEGMYKPTAGKGMYTTESRGAFDFYKRQFNEQARRKWEREPVAGVNLGRVRDYVDELNANPNMKSRFAIEPGDYDDPDNAEKLFFWEYDKDPTDSSLNKMGSGWGKELRNDTLQNYLQSRDITIPRRARSSRYKVLVDAPKEHFLDLGKPLHEQSEFVQSRLFDRTPEGLNEPLVDVTRYFGDPNTSTVNIEALVNRKQLSGQTLMSNLDSLARSPNDEAYAVLPDPDAARLFDGMDLLRRAGIPGTRFTSRSGNRNTVVNDAAIMHILKVLGIGAATSTALGQAPAQQRSPLQQAIQPRSR